MNAETTYHEDFQDILNALHKFIAKAIAEDDPEKRAELLPALVYLVDQIAGDARMYNIQRDAEPAHKEYTKDRDQYIYNEGYNQGCIDTEKKYQ